MSIFDRQQGLGPPGTVLIQDFHSSEQHGQEIVLHPKPTRDPNDPLNWTRWEKMLNFALTLLYSLVVFGLISAVTPTWTPMGEELEFSYEVLNNSYAAGTAALCVGALLFIPFALKYGRRPIYLISLILQMAVGIWAANIQNAKDLILVNVFNCLLGALAEVIVQMTIADLYFVHERGNKNNIYIWIMLFGSSMAPLIAGYITVGQGWRWVWWWVTILLGLSLVLFFVLYEESKYTPVICGLGEEDSATAHRRSSWIDNSATKEEDESTRKKNAEAGLDTVTSVVMVPIPPRKSFVHKLKLWSPSSGSLKHFLSHCYQPLVMMATIPAVFWVSLLFGLVTAAFQMSITVVASVMPYPPYNFNASQVGLMSLPPLIGTTLGALCCAPFSDRMILWLSRRNEGVYEPEMRLWLLLAFSPFIPAGLMMFGYALHNGNSWVVVAVGYGMISFGMTPVTSISLTYLTDSYTEIIADAVIGVTFLRNAFSTAFIFALPPWIESVGVHNVFLTLAVIAAVVCVGSLGFLFFGRRMRAFTAARLKTYTAYQLDPRAPVTNSQTSFN